MQRACGSASPTPTSTSWSGCSILGKQLFGLEAGVEQAQGYQEVSLTSVRLGRWWQAAGFAKRRPRCEHEGKGWTPHIPSAVLETNDAEVYAAFLRGLFEADGTVVDSVPSLSTANETFAAEIRTVLLALGLATTTRETVSGWGGPIHQIRLRNIEHAIAFDEMIGFIGARKNRLLPELEPAQSGNRDRIHLPREVWDELVPVGHDRRNVVVNSLRKVRRSVPGDCRAASSETLDARLAHALGYLFEPVAENADGGVQPTFDLSVPENVTYVAGGFVSHNTIGLMMDCDTTGIEPDLALVKFKKLVGGGSMQIVNQTVPRALAKLGYQPEQAEAIVEYVGEHGHVIDAPGLRREHYEVFDCAMGERSIAPMGHVRMMAAVQPFLSGAISKTVNMPEAATVEDVEQIYLEGWRLGIKALAIYRDNCKVGQPLSAGKKAKPGTDTAETAHAPVEYRPVRKRLPKKRPSETVSFTVGGAEGYLTSGSYPDDGLGRDLRQAGQAGVDPGGRDGRLLDVDLGRPAVRHPAGVLRLEVLEPAVRAGGDDGRPGRADRHQRHGLPVPPAGARLPAVREARAARRLLGGGAHRPGGRELRGRRGGPGGAAVGRRARHGPGQAGGDRPRAGRGAQLHRAAGAAPGQGRRRAAVHDLRHEDAPGRVVLPV